MAIYLDINATTPCEESVIDKITTAAQYWANPSSGNALGKLAQDVINNSRELIAKMIHGNSRDIIFTSGGTEGNNMVINGILEYYKDWQLHTGMSSSDRPHVITTNVEHDSVILPIRQLEKKKLIDASVIPVSSNGCVNVEELMAQTRPTTCLVTVMMANNETGVIMPIAAIGRCIAEVNEERKSADLVPILFHSDAAQAVGKIPVDVQVLNVNYLTVVGHKFYGPRIGCLYAHGLGMQTPLYPLMYGGGQERGFRPGTENTPMIAGLGEAARLVHLHLCEYSKAMESTRDYLEHKLTVPNKRAGCKNYVDMTIT